MKNWIKIAVGDFGGTPNFIQRHHTYIDPGAVVAVQSNRHDYGLDPNKCCTVYLSGGHNFITSLSAEDLLAQVQSALPG